MLKASGLANSQPLRRSSLNSGYPIFHQINSSWYFMLKTSALLAPKLSTAEYVSLTSRMGLFVIVAILGVAWLIFSA